MAFIGITLIIVFLLAFFILKSNYSPKLDLSKLSEHKSDSIVSLSDKYGLEKASDNTVTIKTKGIRAKALYNQQKKVKEMNENLLCSYMHTNNITEVEVFDENIKCWREPECRCIFF